jgi:cytochrome c biogenesis protein CcdA
LGAAIALASLGQDMMMAFVVMFVFGVGTASVLVVAGLVSGTVLNRVRPGVLEKGARAKKLLGWLLIALGAMVLTGIDKILEAWALGILPDWATQI